MFRLPILHGNTWLNKMGKAQRHKEVNQVNTAKGQQEVMGSEHLTSRKDYFTDRCKSVLCCGITCHLSLVQVSSNRFAQAIWLAMTTQCHWYSRCPTQQDGPV